MKTVRTPVYGLIVAVAWVSAIAGGLLLVFGLTQGVLAGGLAFVGLGLNAIVAGVLIGGLAAIIRLLDEMARARAPNPIRRSDPTPTNQPLRKIDPELFMPKAEKSPRGNP